MKLKLIIMAVLSLGCLSVTKNVVLLNWPDMAGLNYETGAMTPLLKENTNKVVELKGFIVPLELDGYIEEVKEFLLVPDPMACIHVPPPPPNQLVHVKMKESIPLDMDFRGVAIQGTLTVIESNNLFGYEMAGMSATEADIEFDDSFYEWPPM